MKTQIVAILGLALFASVSASARDIKTNLMKVPFAFVAGDKTLPAGEYLVKFDIQTGLTTLYNTAGPVASIISIRDGNGDAKDDDLEFHQVGDTWFLQGVRVSGYQQRLVPSKFEKLELAKLKLTGRQTLIAANVSAR